MKNKINNTTMGEVIFWTIIRIVLTIPVVWLLKEYIDFRYWWILGTLAIYGVVIHPAVIHYRLYEKRNKFIIESTLCSTCQHFDKSAILCMKHDKHPTKDFLPCDGLDWEPKNLNVDNEDIFHG